MHRTDHWLPTLKRTRIPDTHLVMDTEACITKEAGAYRHRFACAALKVVRRRDGHWDTFGVGPPFDTAAALWHFITEGPQASNHVVLWAHNLPYDMRVSRMLNELVEREWELDAISLHKTSTWAGWHKGSKRLTVCDSFSWLPGPLGAIAADLSMDRGDMNYLRATDAELRLRCNHDCAILARAVTDLLTYLQTEDLGPFRPTGSGQSHAAFRRRFLPERTIRIHTDERAISAEREAMHTGRTEAWRHGPYSGPLHEFDMSLAYCRIPCVEKLPVRLIGMLSSPRLEVFDEMSKGVQPLGLVNIVTDVPCVPVTWEGKVIWPVGAFQTVLWEPEVRLALSMCRSVQVEAVWLYQASDALAPMCSWLIERLEDTSGETPPVIKRMLKHWARTVVGRLGLHYRSWEPFGWHPRTDLCISTECEGPEAERFENMRIGHQMFQLSALTESHSSVPSIPGYVASVCRVNLWHLIQIAGAEHVYYMDTDGLLVDSVGATRLHASAIDLPGVVLNYKGAYRNVTIHGPRNVELGEDRRLSGIPRAAIRTAELEFDGETFSGLQSALETGRGDMVEVVPRHWEVTPVDSRREHLDDGMTRPYELKGGDDVVCED